MNPQPQHPGEGPENLRRASVVEYLALVARHKRMMLIISGASLLLAVILLYIVFPRWYKSTAVVMPPKQKNTFGLLSSISRATSPLRNFGLGGPSDDLSQLQTILASRRVKEAVIAKFDLLTVYDLPTLEKALGELESNVGVVLGKEDVSLEIVVYDTDPGRAAAMANFFVETLDRVYLEISVAEARRNREFLQRRYTQNLEDLKNAEEAFRAFQVKYGIYSVPDQVKAAVEAAATLESRIALREVQMGMLARSTSDDNPLRRTLAQEIAELRKQLALMKDGDALGGRTSVVFAPFAKAPEIGMEYLRRYRDIELQGKLLEFLLPMYEQAKIEEQRDTPSVLVLDTAVPAIKPSKPKRMIILAVVLVGSLLVGFFVALTRDALAKARARRTPEELAQVEMIKRELHPKNLFR